MGALFDLSGKKALVTGGGRGIGRAIALGLAGQGADVTVWSRTQAELEETAAAIRALGRQAWVQSVDVTDVGAVNQQAEAARQAMGRIDILINNAGVNVRQKPEDVTEQNYDTIVGLNMRAAFFTAQAVGRIMIAQKGGAIISTSSQTARMALKERVVYSMTKAAIEQMTRCMALEWAPHNITVNGIAPGFVETPMTAEIMKSEEFMEWFHSKSLFPRFIRGDEIAAAAVYLASDSARMVTGQILYVESGWTIH